MSKKSTEVIVDGMKKYGPTVGKLVLEHKKEIVGAIGALGVTERLKKRTDKKSSPKEPKDKIMHPRKKRYQYLLTDVIPALDTRNRAELFQYKLEVEQYIQQIKHKQEQDSIIKKHIHESRVKEWSAILFQIVSQMTVKDYMEYLKLFNNPDYQSEYFKDFEGDVEKFKKLNTVEQYDTLVHYIHEKTNIDIEQIKKEFSAPV
ncbi:MAG: hypothetical protein F9K39_03225 [Exiguobacterium chiriqhucha]|uniref:hypothetical protein n=1 Tax=Exiguobacterium chiriqhucha TaxID=1385984 RepID=UPI00144E50BC|nr:hypothetical protein [Exiguobacterium chiriqhucha]KAB2865007.1 MAG: hypothetical protein F9K39_03225 [Exiguobacterium chiriqhucha]